MGEWIFTIAGWIVAGYAGCLMGYGARNGDRILFIDGCIVFICTLIIDWAF
jgi:hypothetical protein